MGSFIICAMITLIVVSPMSDEQTDQESVQFYDNAGIAFCYPGGWSVDESSGTDDCRFIVVRSPERAKAVILVCPKENIAPLSEFVEWAAQLRVKAVNYTECDLGEIEETVEWAGGQQYRCIVNKYTRRVAFFNFQYTDKYFEAFGEVDAGVVRFHAMDFEAELYEKNFDLILATLLLPWGVEEGD